MTRLERLEAELNDAEEKLRQLGDEVAATSRVPIPPGVQVDRYGRQRCNRIVTVQGVSNHV